MSFRVRLLLSFTLLIAVTFGIGGTIFISASFQTLLENEKEAAIKSYETIQSNLLMLNYFDNRGNQQNMADMLKQMETQNLVQWQSIRLSTDKNIIYEDGDVLLLFEDLEITDPNQYVYTQIRDGDSRRLVFYSELVVEGEILYLRAAFDLSQAYELRKEQEKLFVIIYIAVVCTGISVAAVLSFLLTKRLKILNEGVRKITRGDLDRRTNLRTGDEFEQLSKAFDKMAERLQKKVIGLEDDIQRQEAFMGAVAHELKTPMTSIIGYADLIRQCALDENDQMIAANYIYSEGQRLEKLSHKILDLLLLEKDSFVMKEVSLSTFMKDIKIVLSPLAEKKKIQLNVECERGRVTFEVDLVKSLIYNLVDNAIKSSEEGETVFIYAGCLPGGCEFHIRDEGCGMDKEELNKITEAFYRVDKSRSRAQGGAGLGLTLCKKIVDLHNGSMKFESVKGEGCCVIVELYGDGSR